MKSNIFRYVESIIRLLDEFFRYRKNFNRTAYLSLEEKFKKGFVIIPPVLYTTCRAGLLQTPLAFTFS